MTWTTPPTWVAGQIVTAADMRILNDDLTALSGPGAAWGTATSVWTAATTNPALGNGSQISTYRQDDKWVDVFVQITMGSTTTYGSGAWQIVLPVTARYTRWAFEADALDSSASAAYYISGAATSTTVVTLRALPGTAGNPLGTVNSSAPFTWATGDQFTAAFRYEAA